MAQVSYRAVVGWMPLDIGWLQLLTVVAHAFTDRLGSIIHPSDFYHVLHEIKPTDAHGDRAVLYL